MSARKPALSDIVGQLSDALVFVEVGVLSLAAAEGRGGPELPVLEHGVRELKRALAALDRMEVRS